MIKMANENDDIEAFRAAMGFHIENPWERVKFIFLKNDHGESHPDFRKASDLAQLGFLGGVIIGGYFHQMRYLAELKERSDANIYHNKRDAYRKLSQESFKGFIKGSFSWGPRMGIFMGCFSLFGSCVEAYRNKPGIIEYTIGGFVVGGLFKFNFGIRGMLAGSSLGAVLGTIYGMTLLGLCKLADKNVVDLKYSQYALSKYISEKQSQKFMEREKDKIGLVSSTSDVYLNPLTALSDEEKPKNEAEGNLNK